MKFFKDKFGNWETTAHFTTPTGKQVKNYLEVAFKKGSEPVTESVEGEIILRSEDGTERPCFFSGYQKKTGENVMKMVVLAPTKFGEKKADTSKSVQTSLTGSRDTVDGHIDQELIIDEKDLPFY